jgi:GTPase SAR1 family protein
MVIVGRANVGKTSILNLFIPTKLHVSDEGIPVRVCACVSPLTKSKTVVFLHRALSRPFKAPR